MAKPVDSFPTGAQDYYLRGSKYDKFLDGQVWELDMNDVTEISDFKTLQDFRMSIYTRAAKQGKSVRTRIIRDKLYVQVDGAKLDLKG